MKIHLSLAPLLVPCVVACGPTSRASPELVDARRAYAEAQASSVAEANPAGLYEARRALESAERLERDDPGSAGARNLAYIARQKTTLAEVNARAAIARAEKAEAEKARAVAAGTSPQLGPNARDRGEHATDRGRCGQLGRAGADRAAAGQKARAEKAPEAHSPADGCPEERPLPRKESP